MNFIENGKGLSDDEVIETVLKSLKNIKIEKKVLLIPPDITRYHSKSGMITEAIYKELKEVAEVSVLVALGSHVPMTYDECKRMFGSIPYDKIAFHNWREDVVKLGVVPSEFVKEVSNGLCDFDIDVEVNKRLLEKDTTLISIGQVVPHEVVGMANGNKNIFVGCGGASMINSSHMLGAICDMELIMGRDFSSVRRVFDYAEKKYLQDVNLTYVLSVLDKGKICGTYIGRERAAFESAVALSQKLNIIFLESPLKKVIVNLDEHEYRSTWLGNKAIYRTRLAIEDDGQLIVLGKGVERFGEDRQIDRLINKYGYVGRDKILQLTDANKDLQDNLSASAHLIHGSSNGRFNIVYAVSKLTREQIEQVNYEFADYKTIYDKYNVGSLVNGFNTVNGEEIFYIDNPSVGLWAYSKWFK